MEFIVITGPTFSNAAKKIKKAVKILDGIELRLDLFQNISKEEIIEIRDICKEADKKVIFTLRSSRSGGGYRRSLLSLENEIEKLSLIGPDYFDVEWDLSDDLFNSLGHVKVIASHHDFEKTPPSLDRILGKMMMKKAYAYKLCTTSRALSDSYRMLNFIQKQKNAGLNFIGLCMGEKGKITREDGLKVGNYLNYKIIHIGDKVAAGLDFA